MDDTTMPPVACSCGCDECKAQNCADCSHMNSPEGCDCVGCTCPMHKETSGEPMPAPEPPMAM